MRLISMGPRKMANMAAGDHIIVKTPGGGGYGKPPGEEKDEKLPFEFRVMSH